MSVSTSLLMPDESRLDVIPKLVSCTLFSSDEATVVQGLDELAVLCYNSKRHEQIQSMAPDATTKEEVAEYKKAVLAQDEIENLNRQTMRDFGGHLAICVVMKRWWDSPNVQTACCRALYYAAYPTKDNSTEAFQDLAVHVGAIDIVLTGLQMYPNIEDVQLWGIRALLHLAWYQRNYEPLVLEKTNGISAFITAMNTFPNSKDIQKAACCFLVKICLHSQEIRDLIVAAGGRRVLLAAIENHPENEYQLAEPDSIQRNARNTMKALCEPAEPSSMSPSKNAASRKVTPATMITSNSSAIPLSSDHADSSKGIGSIFKKINLF